MRRRHVCRKTSPGFVVNKGNATAADVIKLTDEVSEKIYELNGVKLELEVKKLGFEE